MVEDVGVLGDDAVAIVGAVGSQEAAQPHRPDLFDKDLIRWDTGKDLSSLMVKLSLIKKAPIFADSHYSVMALPENMLLAIHERAGEKMIGLFCMGNAEHTMAQVPLADGRYQELLTGQSVTVSGGCLPVVGLPLIIKS